MRADKARNREAVLAAVGRLLDEATDPDEVSMDAVAAAAGVGKGTIFRGFGDRATLIRTLYDERVARELTVPPDGDSPADTALALLTRVWTFKQRHRGLTLALERDGQGSPYRTAGYERLHAALTDLLSRARGPANARFLAHALLAAVRSDLVEHLRQEPGTDPLAGLRDLVHHTFRP
ncbi:MULTISPECIES: TetR/AcrR family transcriptional regulator [Catenuloplanes]|uniref:AcrR family transcriptional regulator n=1 Tax=Catenuloplanes niger TaxID=587534 RepID=A0AAE4CQK4_9ACTN|nr:TetR family transcriptional regulator [Catenuloplanes niger]MDR7320592.1 AcrR family transcriptional regulator [Catenuloplanes niger]